MGLYKRAVLPRIASIHNDVKCSRRQSKERTICGNNRRIHVRKADDANRHAFSVDPCVVKRIHVVLHRKIARSQSQQRPCAYSPLRRNCVRFGLKSSLAKNLCVRLGGKVIHRRNARDHGCERRRNLRVTIVGVVFFVVHEIRVYFRAKGFADLPCVAREFQRHPALGHARDGKAVLLQPGADRGYF